ncbi:MAG TPA: adenylate/guanylate cyclase domain-containing protein [Dehalococcoidia bacterium]|nr:adenylate/guanylate cyclase domain-containing protein [Dehalococcoidia bacterium]
MPFLSKRSKRQSRRLAHIGIVIAVGCLFTLLAILVQPFTSIGSWLSDQLFVPEPPSPNIVIVGIDDASLETYGRWSEWQRSLHAQAINNLSQAGARVIGLDILFADTSSDDLVLAQAIERAGNVVLPVVGVEPLPSARSEVTFRHFLLPTAPLGQACLSLGHANVVSDGDGVVRRLPLLVKDSSGQTYPAFTLAVLHALFPKPLPQEYLLQDGKVHLLERDIPVDASSRLRINFTDVAESYAALSYGDVIAGSFDPLVVEHKIVLVGMIATGELDTWLTPVSASKLSGVWIHANAMDTILRQRFLMDTDWRVTLMVMLLLVAITGLALPRLKLKWGGVLVAGLLAGYLVSVFLAFDTGYILNVLHPVMLLPLAYVTSVLCMVVAEQSDKRLIKDLFGRYVSPQVATEILELADVGRLELGGEKRTVSVFFADIRGFTQMSEQMSPEDIVDMLNDYLSIIIQRILDNDGMVNKFAGDNVMAVWNAPQFQQDHARLAVKAAWEAQQDIMERQRTDDSLPRVQFGIGINTGEAVAGNMGSSGRAEYTVIGDAVNLASRICGATTGGEVWIGHDTYRQVMDDVEVEELEPRSFKGKAEPVVVYKVVGLR